MAVQSKQGAVAELLGRLVACPSVNPGGGAPGPDGGELRMATLLGDMVRPWGADTRVIDLGLGRCTFLATWPGKQPERTLLLDAHADTVTIEGMTIAPFDPVVRGGRLYGRGACDTKGGMAAMLLAIRSILDADGEPPVTLRFVATGDEEDGAKGAAQLVGTGLRADGAIVAEPTDLRIVTAHRGVARFSIVLGGRAAHSSVPASGINAVEAAAVLVDALRRDFATRFACRAYPGLESPTVCVTMIEGGTRINIVPDRCRIGVDCRCLPGETREHLERAMRDCLDTLCESWPGLTAASDLYQWYPAMAGQPDDAFAACMRAGCADALGDVTCTTAPYGTNGGHFSAAGIPCIVFGPGSIEQAHTADESVELEQVARAVDAYAGMIRAFGRSTHGG